MATLEHYVQLSANKYIEKDTGYLICENAVLGSTGYQEYYAWELGLDNVAPNTKIKVYRPAEEVFNQESMQSLENKAVCLLHPSESVNSSNDSELRKGSVYNVRQDGNVLKGTLQITDKDTIEKVKYIKCLSLGYDLTLEPMSDDGTTYVAKNIRYNHIAIVPKGRSKVAMITDSAIEDKNEEGGNDMSLFKKAKETDEEVETKETEKVDEVCDEKVCDESEEKVEKRDEKDGAEEDTVTKEIEKRIAKGDYTEEDLKKLLAKLSSKKGKEEAKEDYKEREKYEEKKEAKDSVSISTEEYKALLMGQKGLVYGNDTSAFKRTEKTEAKDSEAERKSYYRNTLNPHKNADFAKEFGKISELVEF